MSLWVTHSAPGADYPLFDNRTVCSSQAAGSNFISFRVRIGRKNDDGETAGDLSASEHGHPLMQKMRVGGDHLKVVQTHGVQAQKIRDIW